MSKFKKGDRIKRKNPNTGLDESGVVEDVSAVYYFWGADDEYTVLWDSGVKEVLIASYTDPQMELENSSSQNCPITHVKQLSFFDDEYDKKPINLPEGLRVDIDKLRSCSHKWKRYTGFLDEYEYCEVCDAKKV